MKANGNVDAQLDALGDPTRRAVFESIASAPKGVGEVAAVLPISRPAVSQHVKILKDAGLLSVRREGTRNIYAVDASGIAVLRATVERFWRDALVTYKETAEREDSDT